MFVPVLFYHKISKPWPDARVRGALVEPHDAAILEVQLLLDVGGQDRFITAVTRASVGEACPRPERLGSR